MLCEELGLMRTNAVLAVPHKCAPELESLGFISPVSMAIFQMLEPDSMKRPNWLSPIDYSISHEFTEMLEHGFLLCWLHQLENHRVS